MEIREAKYLLEIARTKHLSKAAKSLYVTQPALSKMLKKFEAEFGTAIFVRENNEFVPTEVGEIILESSKIILDEYQRMNNAIKSIQNMDDNWLRVALPEMGGFYTSELLTSFLVTHSEYHLTIHEVGGCDAIEMFRQKKIDVAFLLQPVNLKNYNAHLVYSSELAVGIGAEHPWVKKDFIRLTDFDNQPHASTGTNNQFYFQLRNAFADHRVVSDPAWLTKDIAGLMSYCIGASVPCILPKPYFDYYNHDTMVVRRFEPSFPWRLMCVYPQENERHKMTQAFVQHAMRHFEKSNQDIQ